MNETTHKRVCDRIDAVAEELIEVSHAIHGRPELAFEEHFACETLSSTLSDHGLAPATGVFTLPTAFEAQINADTAGPTVAILAEYDALPGIGHACGHNIIATSALGATLGLAAVADTLPGTVRLIGTPAEERGGGKELHREVPVRHGVHGIRRRPVETQQLGRHVPVCWKRGPGQRRGAKR